MSPARLEHFMNTAVGRLAHWNSSRFGVVPDVVLLKNAGGGNMSLTVFEVLSYNSWLHSSLTNTRGVTRSGCKCGFIFLPIAELARSMYCYHKTKPNQNKTKSENIFLILFTICVPICQFIFKVFEGRELLLHCIPYRRPQLKIKLFVGS